MQALQRETGEEQRDFSLRRPTTLQEQSGKKRPRSAALEMTDVLQGRVKGTFTQAHAFLPSIFFSTKSRSGRADEDQCNKATSGERRAGSAKDWARVFASAI
jgi:hypothetical protein